MANFLLLPEPCLIIILDKLSILDLFRSGQVCKRLHYVHEVVCHRKKELRLFGDSRFHSLNNLDILDFYGIGAEFDFILKFEYHEEFYPKEFHIQCQHLITLKYNWLCNYQSIEVLGRRLPNILKLSILSNNSWTNYYLARLISNWPNLRSLKLINIYESQFMWPQLCAAMVRLTSLRHLSTNLRFSQMTQLTPLLRNAPLEELFADCFYVCDLPAFIDLLNGYTPKDNSSVSNLKQLGFRAADVDQVNAFSDFCFSTKMNNLTHVSMLVTYYDHLELICTNWHSITFLDIDFLEVSSIASVLGLLVKLQFLKKLIISFGPYYDPELQITEEDETLPRLESVINVQFRIVADPHKLLAIETAFPNADRISIRASPEWFTSEPQELKIFCDSCQQTAMNCLKKYTDQIESIQFCIKNGDVSVCKIRFRWLRQAKHTIEQNIGATNNHCTLNFDYLDV